MTAVTLAAALLLAAPAGPPPPPPEGAPAAGGQRVELTVRFPPWEFTGTFTLDGAGFSDHGVARDQGSLTGPDAAVVRLLTGERGTITLALQGALHAASFPALFGGWQVTGATGDYAGLVGGGTFTATDLGTGKGSPLELQVLLGRVAPARRPPGWRERGLSPQGTPRVGPAAPR